MPTAFEKLAELLRALNVEDVRYVLFGGQAVNLHGIPRFTEDIDLFVEPTADNIRRLRRALTEVWHDPEIEKICVEDLAGDYAVVRYGTPDGFAVDLVGRIGEMFEFKDVESETLLIGGVPARLATPRMLYRMKKGTVRPIDHADAADLRAKFDIKDD
ncbi:MAG: nucleotidyl transferase AbiEii/AbiGii toxin family protein [Deltaproteobacteria bacterium]|nr:nucleotidyl transferase AbiEii/AbiGii toxin family protein [Deltaproteobacteria bacterium]